MWELNHKEDWTQNNWCFYIVVLGKNTHTHTLENPLNCKEIKSVNPKEYQPWIFIGRTDVEIEAAILWPPDAKNWLIGKDPDGGKDWKQEEKWQLRMRWLDGIPAQWIWVWANPGRWWRRWYSPWSCRDTWFSYWRTSPFFPLFHSPSCVFGIFTKTGFRSWFVNKVPTFLFFGHWIKPVWSSLNTSSFVGYANLIVKRTSLDNTENPC